MSEPRGGAAGPKRAATVRRVRADREHGGRVARALDSVELRPRGPLYRPTWWERRFPWLLDALVALDPEPLAKPFAPLSRATSAAAEWLCAGPARLLDRTARGVHRVSSTASATLGAALRALPLPGTLRDWLWLRPIRLEGSRFSNAQELWRYRGRRFGPVALVLALAAHAAVFVLWPTMTVTGPAGRGDELAAIQLPPSVEIPPPPEQIPRPATPRMATTDVADDLTIAPTTFEAQPPVAALPAPTVQETEQPRRPTMTPFTVAPEILNPVEVRTLLVTEYPPLLRQSGIGGAIVMWFYLGKDGAVVEVRIAQGSGYEQLDAAAIRVAERIRFSPALNRDQYVAAWVQFPIEFRVR